MGELFVAPYEEAFRSKYVYFHCEYHYLQVYRKVCMHTYIITLKNT